MQTTTKQPMFTSTLHLIQQPHTTFNNLTIHCASPNSKFFVLFIPPTFSGYLGTSCPAGETCPLFLFPPSPGSDPGAPAHSLQTKPVHVPRPSLGGEARSASAVDQAQKSSHRLHCQSSNYSLTLSTTPNRSTWYFPLLRPLMLHLRQVFQIITLQIRDRPPLFVTCRSKMPAQLPTLHSKPF